MRIPSTIPVVEPPRHFAGQVDVRPVSARANGTLALASPDASGREFVSAASGIAAAAGAAWVVSDEYGELARFDGIDRPGRLVPGLTPLRGKKPDLEAVLRLPALDASSGATLLALGSGSAPTRNRGALVQLDERGAMRGAVRAVDLARLYEAIDGQVPSSPNIEGAAWRDGRDGAELLLFHRGQLEGERNAIIRLDGQAVLDALRAGRPLPETAIRETRIFDLGMLGGAPLGFADARALPDGRIAFIASSEANDGSSGDGEIRGSVAGMLDADLRLTALRPLAGPPRKAEGIELARELDPTAPADRFVVVTDPDSPRTPTELLTIDLD